MNLLIALAYLTTSIVVYRLTVRWINLVLWPKKVKRFRQRCPHLYAAGELPDTFNYAMMAIFIPLVWPVALPITALWVHTVRAIDPITTEEFETLVPVEKTRRG